MPNANLVEIRNGTKEDLEYIFEAETETLSKSHICSEALHQIRNRKQRLEKAIEGGSIYVMQESSVFVGYFWLENRKEAGWFLVDFYVDAAFRRLRVGTRMLDWILRKIRAERAGGIRLVISDHNEPSISFFKKHGAMSDDQFPTEEGLRDYWLPLNQ